MSTECRHTIINIIAFGFIISVADLRVVESVQVSERAGLLAVGISVCVTYKYIMD